MTRKIVVVEDDQPILDLMEILLKKLGYEPVLIPNGLDALNYVRSEPPALILLDIMMSPLSGWEFLERLRTEYNHAGDPGDPLYRISHGSREDGGIHDPKLGILQKPVTLNELQTALQQFLG